MIISRLQSIRIFLLKDMLLTGVKRFFAMRRTKNTVPWIYVISDSNGAEIIGSFYEKELQKTNQK